MKEEKENCIRCFYTFMFQWSWCCLYIPVKKISKVDRRTQRWLIIKFILKREGGGGWTIILQSKSNNAMFAHTKKRDLHAFKSLLEACYISYASLSHNNVFVCLTCNVYLVDRCGRRYRDRYETQVLRLFSHVQRTLHESHFRCSFLYFKEPQTPTFFYQKVNIAWTQFINLRGRCLFLLHCK